MSRPTHFSCCVAEVDPPQRCAKTTADGLQSAARQRQGCAFLKNVSQQASGWIMMGKLSFSLWPCFVIVPGVKIGKKYHLCMRLCVEFPLFSSWLVNGLLKWGWWHFGLMGTKVLYRIVKRLCLLFPKKTAAKSLRSFSLQGIYSRFCISVCSLDLSWSLPHVVCEVLQKEGTKPNQPFYSCIAELNGRGLLRHNNTYFVKIGRNLFPFN